MVVLETFRKIVELMHILCRKDKFFEQTVALFPLVRAKFHPVKFQKDKVQIRRQQFRVMLVAYLMAAYVAILQSSFILVLEMEVHYADYVNRLERIVHSELHPLFFQDSKLTGQLLPDGISGISQHPVPVAFLVCILNFHQEFFPCVFVLA